MNWKQRTLCAVTAAVLAIGVAPPLTAATTSVASSSLSPTRAATTTELELLESSMPKTAVLDPATGAVVSVTLGEPTASDTASSEISGGTDCGAGDGCYYTPVVNSTYHDRSFYGSSGTFTGSWPKRSAWDSGSYDASVCWVGACSQEVGPNTYSTFGGSLVTGTSFTIY